MTTHKKKALRRLANNEKLALKLAREMNRQVHTSQTDRSVFCAADGTLYISWEPVGQGDIKVHTSRVCDFTLLIGPEYEDSPDGYESFDDVDDSVWADDAETMQCKAAELLHGS